jgi:hypothetical protein
MANLTTIQEHVADVVTTLVDNRRVEEPPIVDEGIYVDPGIYGNEGYVVGGKPQ